MERPAASQEPPREGERGAEPVDNGEQRGDREQRPVAAIEAGSRRRRLHDPPPRHVFVAAKEREARCHDRKKEQHDDLEERAQQRVHKRACGEALESRRAAHRAETVETSAAGSECRSGKDRDEHHQQPLDEPHVHAG
eukprot:Amastigsp_a5172_8.p2 type:complete len:138 gc:universal Amastigsp_a5172_8:670-1083(+)